MISKSRGLGCCTRKIALPAMAQQQNARLTLVTSDNHPPSLAPEKWWKGDPGTGQSILLLNKLQPPLTFFWQKSLQTRQSHMRALLWQCRLHAHLAVIHSYCFLSCRQSSLHSGGRGGASSPAFSAAPCMRQSRGSLCGPRPTPGRTPRCRPSLSAYDLRALVLS